MFFVLFGLITAGLFFIPILSALVLAIGVTKVYFYFLLNILFIIFLFKFY